MSKVTSDGSTASYYELPAGAKELQHLISYRNMNGQLAEIFRACYRYGIVSHSDQLRDAKKMVFYAMAEVERLEKWAPLSDLASSTGAKFSEYDREADAFLRTQPFTLNAEAIHAEPSTEDMTDPRNWRAGDWVEFIYATGVFYTQGCFYRLTESSSDEHDFDILDDNGNGEHRWDRGRLFGFFRFHARPDADGWIKHEGSFMPVGGLLRVQYECAGGNHGGIGNAIHIDWARVTRYRPHLATSQDKD